MSNLQSIADPNNIKENQFNETCDFSIWLRTCNQEIEKPIPGYVSFGEVPKWLSGSLIRNGPGGVDAYGARISKHVFDAPGLLHKYHINNGNVTYSSKFVNGNSFRQNRAAGRLVLSEFGTARTPDPCQTIFSKIATVFQTPSEKTLTDNANISIHPFGDEIYTLAETPFAHRINLENLETLNTINVYNEIGLLNHTSHPHVCGNTVYNVGQKLGLLTGLQYVIAEMECNKSRSTDPIQNNGDFARSPWSVAKIVATISPQTTLKTSYMHSFAITENYFILIEQPLYIFLPDVPLKNIWGGEPIVSCLQFDAQKDTLFHVISRNPEKSVSTQRVFRAPGFFFFHTINAFEVLDQNTHDIHITVDICCYDDPRVIECLYVDALQNAHANPDYAKMLRGRPKRFSLKFSDCENTPRGSSLVEEKVIVDIGCETPRINMEYNGKPYSYFYAICSDVDAQTPGMLIQVNVSQNTYCTWMEPNAYPSEPIFVPSPNSQGEDDGVVLSTLLYGGENLTGPNMVSLAILDAHTWQLITKVDILCETAIPKCLHGWFFPDSDVMKCHTSDFSENG
ncbi:Carotenoid isomerooxygenase [Orchesella cincta]|uniref:Carotenoid isomerooxygenase n=1 Tax=Orchesella cincta TaxID=48709 RepID=A0A1D2MEG1_ORCCI|nr:Carotenoid isomerooxygenase [Orchesella cincta]